MVFDKVMLLARLKEEEVIVVCEVKQHMEYMGSVAGLIKDLTSQLTEDINRKCKNNKKLIFSSMSFSGNHVAHFILF